MSLVTSSNFHSKQYENANNANHGSLIGQSLHRINFWEFTNNAN